MTNNQGNTNQNLIRGQNGYYQKESTSVDKDMQKSESLRTTSGNINWCSHYGILLEAHRSGRRNKMKVVKRYKP